MFATFPYYFIISCKGLKFCKSFANMFCFRYTVPELQKQRVYYTSCLWSSGSSAISDFNLNRCPRLSRMQNTTYSIILLFIFFLHLPYNWVLWAINRHDPRHFSGNEKCFFVYLLQLLCLFGHIQNIRHDLLFVHFLYIWSFRPSSCVLMIPSIDTHFNGSWQLTKYLCTCMDCMDRSGVSEIPLRRTTINVLTIGLEFKCTGLYVCLL